MKRGFLKDNRLAALFSMLGLAALIPAYYLPALLVSNAVDGSQWFSIWSGIATFYQGGHLFLAGLIFVFSFIFPLAKLVLMLVACAGSAMLPTDWRRGIIQVTGWTAKYSMLDVLVIAMLIVMVKVDEYVRVEPTIGIYLFSFAIVCSALANMTAEILEPGAPVREPNRDELWGRLLKNLAPILIGGALAVTGAVLLGKDKGGEVDGIRVTRLNDRIVPRSAMLANEAFHSFREKDNLFDLSVLKKIWDVVPSAMTDLKLAETKVSLWLTTASGEEIQTEETVFDLEKEEAEQFWKLPEPLVLRDIRGIEMVSEVKVKEIPIGQVTEESLSVANDPFRMLTRTWYGSIFQFEMQGPPRGYWHAGWALFLVGLGVVFWFLIRVVVPAPNRSESNDISSHSKLASV